jgi:hypothetical protein
VTYADLKSDDQAGARLSAQLGAKAKEELDYFSLCAMRANASWLPAVPAPLFDRAQRSRDGGKLLSRWLAFQLQLLMPGSLALADHERWLLRPRDFYQTTALELGATLSSAWIRTKISRQVVMHLQQALGEPLFAESLARRHPAPGTALVSILDRAASMEALRDMLRALGAYALLSTLADDERKLPLRARLAYPKRWPEYDVLSATHIEEGFVFDTAFIQTWLQARCKEGALSSSEDAKSANGESR